MMANRRNGSDPRTHSRRRHTWGAYEALMRGAMNGGWRTEGILPLPHRKTTMRVRAVWPRGIVANSRQVTGLPLPAGEPTQDARLYKAAFREPGAYNMPMRRLILCGCRLVRKLLSGPSPWLYNPNRNYIMATGEDFSELIEKAKRRPMTSADFDLIKKRAIEEAANNQKVAKTMMHGARPSGEQIQDMYSRKVAVLREQVAKARKRNKAFEDTKRTDKPDQEKMAQQPDTKADAQNVARFPDQGFRLPNDLPLRGITEREQPNTQEANLAKKTRRFPKRSASATQIAADQIKSRDGSTPLTRTSVQAQSDTDMVMKNVQATTEPASIRQAKIAEQKEHIGTVRETQKRTPSQATVETSFAKRLRAAEVKRKRKTEEDNKTSGIQEFFDKKLRAKKRQPKKTKLSLLRTVKFDETKEPDPQVNMEPKPAPSSNEGLSFSDVQYLKREGIEVFELKLHEGRKPLPKTVAKVPAAVAARMAIQYRRSPDVTHQGYSVRDEIGRYLTGTTHNRLRTKRQRRPREDEVWLLKVVPEVATVVQEEPEPPPTIEVVEPPDPLEPTGGQWTAEFNKYVPSAPIGLASCRSLLDRVPASQSMPSVKQLLEKTSSQTLENEYDTPGSRFIKMSADLVSKSKSFIAGSRLIGGLLASTKTQ